MPRDEWDDPVPRNFVPPTREKANPAPINQVIEAGDIVVVKGLYLSPQIIVMNACTSTKQVQGSWFDKDYRLQIANFPAEDLVVRSKRTDTDLRLAS